MRVWKLVSGILSIILFAVVMFQSCAAGVVNALEDNGGISGSVGVIVGILMLAGGIVSIATRNKTGKGHDIALIVLFGLAAVFGFASLTVPFNPSFSKLPPTMTTLSLSVPVLSEAPLALLLSTLVSDPLPIAIAANTIRHSSTPMYFLILFI